MSEESLLKTGTIEITTKVARFDDIAYQVANIGSIAVYVTKKLNPYALAMFILAILVGFWASQLPQYASDQIVLLFSIAAALIVGAIAVQAMWPQLVFTLVLKTSSSDVHKIESTDRAHVNAIRGAVEEAFVRRA